jgi:hypothetical protein
MKPSIALSIQWHWDTGKKCWHVRFIDGRGILLYACDMPAPMRGAFDSADIKRLAQSLAAECSGWLC